MFLVYYYSHYIIYSADLELDEFIPVLQIIDFLIIPHLIKTFIGLIEHSTNVYLTSVLIRNVHLLRQQFKDALIHNIKGADDTF